MEKLAFTTITGEKDINLFLDKFQNYVGVRLPYDYAANSKIIGVYIKNKLVGGYMLVTKPGFRSLLFVPDAVKKSNPFFLKDQYEMMEVNGLWLGPQIKTARAQFSVWMRLMMDVINSRKNFILLMGDARNRNIEHIHGLTGPIALYEGAPFLFGDTTSHEKVRVSFTTRWKIIRNLPKYWMEYREREQRAKLLANHRNYSRNLKDVEVEAA